MEGSRKISAFVIKHKNHDCQSLFQFSLQLGVFEISNYFLKIQKYTVLIRDRRERELRCRGPSRRNRAGTGNIIFEIIGKAGNGRVPDIGSRRSLTGPTHQNRSILAAWIFAPEFLPWDRLPEHSNVSFLNAFEQVLFSVDTKVWIAEKIRKILIGKISFR